MSKNNLLRFAALIILSNICLYTPWHPLRVIGALILILIPGLLLTARYFTDENGLATIVSTAGIAYAVLILSTLAFHYLPGGIHTIAYLLYYDLLNITIFLRVESPLTLTLREAYSRGYSPKRRENSLPSPGLSQSTNRAAQTSRRFDFPGVPTCGRFADFEKALLPSPLWGEGLGVRGKLALLITALLLLIAFFRFAHLGYAEFRGDESKVALKAMSIIKGTDELLFWHKKGPGEILITASIFSLTRAYGEGVARAPFAVANVAAMLTLCLLARRWWNDRVAVIVGLCAALTGYFIGYGRLVQYESVVLLFTALTIYYFYRFYVTEESRYLLLGAGLIGVSLLLHFDTIFSIPPAIYLVYRRWKFAPLAPSPFPQRGEGRNFPLPFGERVRVRGRLALALATLLVISIPALYFVPFLTTSHTARTAQYLGNRIGGDPPYNNLLRVFFFTVVYDSIYYLVLLFGLVAAKITALLSKITRLGRVFAALWLISLAAIVATYIPALPPSPEAWIVAGKDLTFLPFAVAFLILWFGLSAPVEIKTTLLWFFAPFLAYNFGIAIPNTHVYCFFPATILLAAAMLDEIIARVPQSHRRAVIGVLLLLYLPLAYYPYMAYINHEPEYLRNFTELRSSFYWTPFEKPLRYGYFGFPYNAGWKTIAQLYRAGILEGNYDSNEQDSITAWYLPGVRRQSCYSHYYFVASNAETNIEIPRAHLDKYYAEIAQVTVNDVVKMRVYELNAAADTPMVYAEEEYAPQFLRETTRRDFMPFPVSWCNRTANVGEHLIYFIHEQCRAAMLTPQFATDANFDNKARLRGYDLETALTATPPNILVTLYWDVIDAPKDMDSVFVHLEADRLWGQGDGIPVCNDHATDWWVPGEIVIDRHLIELETAPPPGDYPLTVGFYRWDDGARLPVLNEQGAVVDTSFTLTKLSFQ